MTIGFGIGIAIGLGFVVWTIIVGFVGVFIGTKI